MQLKKILPLLAVLFVVSIAPITAQAATASFYGPIVPNECNCPNSAASYGCVLAVIQNIINIAISIGLAIAVLILVYAGFSFMVNSTNPEKRGAAIGMIINVMIGLVILLSAWLVIDFIMKKLYNPDTTSAGVKFGPWNSILQGRADDQCIVAGKPHAIPGVIGSALTAELVGGSGQQAPSTGTGANCPAADPASMVSFPSSVTSGGPEKATATTVQNFLAMRTAALKDGIDLKVIDGYRSDAEQVALWNQFNHDTSQAAKPCSLGGGGSNHNSGTALDLTVGCSKTNSSCNSPQYRWLKTYGAQWNFRNALPTDTVHWSPSGH